MYETVIQLDLTQDDLYVRHQKMDRLMSEQQDRQPRDYLYAVQGDQVYLRASRPRATVDGWRAMQIPTAEHSCTVSGIVYIDATRFDSRARLLWRHPQFQADYIGQRLAPLGSVSDVQALPQAGLPMSKPGTPKMLWTPLYFTAKAVITSAEDAANILRRGIGRGKAFGFGCVHIKPTTGEATA